MVTKDIFYSLTLGRDPYYRVLLSVSLLFALLIDLVINLGAITRDTEGTEAGSRGRGRLTHHCASRLCIKLVQKICHLSIQFP